MATTSWAPRAPSAPSQALTGTWVSRYLALAYGDETYGEVPYGFEEFPPSQASSGTFALRYSEGELYGEGLYGEPLYDLGAPSRASTGVWVARIGAPPQASTGTWTPRYTSTSPGYGGGAYGSGLFGR